MLPRDDEIPPRNVLRWFRQHEGRVNKVPDIFSLADPDLEQGPSHSQVP